jgi:hypothetical protein
LIQLSRLLYTLSFLHEFHFHVASLSDSKMQRRKNQRIAFAALAFLSSCAFSSPAHPISRSDKVALFSSNSLVLQERGIPIVESTVPLNLLSDHADGAQLAKRHSGGPLRTIFDGAQYAIDVTIGTEMLQVLFDTGSSSFWVPKADFVCVDINGKQQWVSTPHPTLVWYIESDHTSFTGLSPVVGFRNSAPKAFLAAKSRARISTSHMAEGSLRLELRVLNPSVSEV